jgi:hypothetical protein
VGSSVSPVTISRVIGNRIERPRLTTWSTLYDVEIERIIIGNRLGVTVGDPLDPEIQTGSSRFGSQKRS